MRSSFIRKNSRLTFTRRIVSSPVVLRSWKHPLYICGNLPFYLHRCSCPRFFVPLFFLIAHFIGTLMSYHFFFDSVFYNFISAFVSPSPLASVISMFLNSCLLRRCLLFLFLHFFSLSSSFHNFIDSLPRFEQRDGIAVWTFRKRSGPLCKSSEMISGKGVKGSPDTKKIVGVSTLPAAFCWIDT